MCYAGPGIMAVETPHDDGLPDRKRDITYVYIQLYTLYIHIVYYITICILLIHLSLPCLLVEVVKCQ